MNGRRRVILQSSKLEAPVMLTTTDLFQLFLIAKNFEKIIYDQFYKYLSVNNLLSICQSGFRALHSTVTSLLN